MDTEDKIDIEVAAVHASMVSQGLISVKQRVSDEEHVVVKRVAGPVPTKSAQELLDEEPMMRWFQYAHLPTKLQRVSESFCALAVELVLNHPKSAERTVALRKLLESKDAAVRSAL